MGDPLLLTNVDHEIGPKVSIAANQWQNLSWPPCFPNTPFGQSRSFRDFQMALSENSVPLNSIGLSSFLLKYVNATKFGGFPNLGYPQIIHFNRMFHEINHPAMGVPKNCRKPTLRGN